MMSQVCPIIFEVSKIYPRFYIESLKLLFYLNYKQRSIWVSKSAHGPNPRQLGPADLSLGPAELYI